jgi:LysM repeat protein
MRRTYVRRSVLCLALLSAVGFLGPWIHGASAQVSNERYVVRPGDTLWMIASKAGGTGSDPRPLMDRIESLNHLADGQIRTGQTLLVPEG